MAHAKRYLANPDVSCRRQPDGADLFNPDSSDLVAINGVGYLIWQALARPRTRKEIATYLVAICHDAPAEQVTADVVAFLQALQPKGFVGEVLPRDGPLPGAVPAAPRPAATEIAPARSSNPDHGRFYHGNSMAGTFRFGDYLLIEQATISAIHPGDVVIFGQRSPDGELANIVHRVVTITPGGLLTRGDNSPGVDDDLVSQDMLLGRVAYLERDGRRRRVRGGRWGTFQVRVRRGWRQMRRRGWRLLKAVARPAYRRLRASSLARRLWQPALTRLLVTSSGDLVVKYVHGRRTVARWRPQTGRFRCRKPYDLIILPPEGKVPAFDRPTAQE